MKINVAPAPQFGWVWDMECLISKTLYGPRICVKVEFEKRRRRRRKINTNNDENKMFAPPPLFGWVWDRECLISKTLYGP